MDGRLSELLPEAKFFTGARQGFRRLLPFLPFTYHNNKHITWESGQGSFQQCAMFTLLDDGLKSLLSNFTKNNCQLPISPYAP
jgi:hypothetical protein